VSPSILFPRSRSNTIFSAFLALDETRLCKICALTLQVYPVDASAEYIDLQLLADLNHRQVIVVTKDESQQSFIRVLSYPGNDKPNVVFDRITRVIRSKTLLSFLFTCTFLQTCLPFIRSKSPVESS
jgi:hypothetical protein